MLKTTTKWKKLNTWWSWAHNPQTFWRLRINNVNCSVTTPSNNQRTVHEQITYPVMLLPPLAFKNAFLKSFGEFGVLRGMSHPFLLAWPCNKLFSAPNSNVLLFGLTVHQAHELGVGNRTTAVFRRSWSICFQEGFFMCPLAGGLSSLSCRPLYV